MTIFCKKYNTNKVLFTCIPESYLSQFKEFIAFFEQYSPEDINNFYIYTKEHTLHVLKPLDGTIVPIFKIKLPTDIQAENDYLTLFRLASHFKVQHIIPNAQYDICLDLQSLHIDDFSKLFNLELTAILE